MFPAVIDSNTLHIRLPFLRHRDDSLFSLLPLRTLLHHAICPFPAPFPGESSSAAVRV